MKKEIKPATVVVVIVIVLIVLVVVALMVFKGPSKGGPLKSPDQAPPGTFGPGMGKGKGTAMQVPGGMGGGGQMGTPQGAPSSPQ